MSVFKKDDATPNNRVIPPNKRKKNAPYKYLLILGAVSLIAIASVISSVTIHIRYRRQTNRFIEAGLTEPAYSFDAAVKMANAAEASGRKAVLDDIIENFSSGTSTLSYLRNTFPDKIVFADDGRYVFTDINRSLPMHNLNRSAFAKDEAGFMTYSDSAIQTHRGIDVSRYQGNIDWGLVREDGIEFAFLRAGYRAYGTGAIKEDDSFKNNATGALANGLHVGAYFFSQAITKEEAEEEADFMINSLKPFKIDYPVVIDIEEIVNDTYRQQELSQEQLTDIVIAFCDKIKSAGYTPMIYANIKGFTSLVDISRLTAYEKWYAEYNPTPYIPYDISIWQYSEKGRIKGIDGNVDLNISFKTW